MSQYVQVSTINFILLKYHIQRSGNNKNEDDSRQCITPGRNAKICPKVLSKIKLEKNRFNR